jgi:hypothetical protein
LLPKFQERGGKKWPSNTTLHARIAKLLRSSVQLER